MHGREAEAEENIALIEREVEASGQRLAPVDESQAIEITPAERHGYLSLVKVLFREYPRRSILGATLMITQSFLYNAIFFSYGLVLTKFYGVPAGNTRCTSSLSPSATSPARSCSGPSSTRSAGAR